MSLHVVLVHPEIHWNTGNAGRTCLATGATLHLIEPLGFSLDEREVKRAGLDYWEHVDVRVWPSWEAFEAVLPTLGEPFFFSTKGTTLFWDAPLASANGATPDATAPSATAPSATAPSATAPNATATNGTVPLGTVLVFGRETGGLPAELHERYADRFVTLPMHSSRVRSLNLSTSVAVAVYEVLRQTRDAGR